MVSTVSRSLAGVAVAALLLSSGGAALAQEKVLRVAMTAADIPRTTGQPDQGFEGNRFTGIPLFDALTHWDLSSADKPSVLIPGLATEWAVDAADKTKWVFKLRQGVKFHDGSDLKADAVVWNVEKVLKKEAPHFAPDQIGVTVSRMPNLVSARKIDDYTVELTTKEPDSFIPINLTNLFMASPAHWQKKYRRAGQRQRSGRAGQAGLGRLRRRRFGLGAVQDGQVHAARARGIRQERQLLGCQAQAEDRPHRPAADARGQRPHRGSAVGPGRLDRGAGARRHPADQVEELRALHQRAAARVAVAVLVRRGLALARQAGAPGRQPVRQPRRAEAAARRLDGSAQGHRAARAIRGGAIRSSTSSTIRPPPRS